MVTLVLFDLILVGCIVIHKDIGIALCIALNLLLIHLYNLCLILMKVANLLNRNVFVGQNIFIFFRWPVIIVYYTIDFPAVYFEAVKFLSEFLHFRVELLLEISIISTDLIFIFLQFVGDEGFLGEEQGGEYHKLISALFGIFDGWVVHVM